MRSHVCGQALDARLLRALVFGAVAVKLWKWYSRVSKAKHTLAVTDAATSILPVASPASPFQRYFRSDATGMWVYHRRWVPACGADSARGVVCVIHGYAEHIGRYDHVVALLLASNYIVVGMDHCGHGQSEGERAYIENFDHFVEDVIQWVTKEALHESDAALPKFLLAHSMGGLIGIHASARTASLWRGVILSGPAIVPDPKTATPLLRALSGVMSSFAPKLGVIKLQSNAISRDPLVVRSYLNDPLVYHGPILARFGAEFMRAMDEVWTVAPGYSIPLLVMHGEKDTLALPEGSSRFVASAASSDKHLILYPDMFHEIFNEPEADRAQVLSDLTRWLADRS